MKPKDPRFIRRREFLISTATLAGVGLPAIGWAASKPCPPSTLSVTGGSSTTSSCASSGGLPVLTLTSAAVSGIYPWTFGQAFRKGDVPNGSYITGDSSGFQAEVRNRWSDGSVKFAVLSGISSFTQGQPRAVGLSTTSSTPVGTNVAEPSSLDVSVAFSGGVSGTYALQSVLGLDKESWGSKATGGRVRKILGPVMSEFHYYVPTSDPHIAVWFFVRRYSTGATEVETVIENGWLRVASPGQRDYTVTVRVGGATVYGPAALNHLHHTRWSRIDWIGVNPSVTPKHDGTYVKATRLVPNYGEFGQPSEATLNGLVQSAEPFGQAGWPSEMGNAGSGGCILNNWDALYVNSGDLRAYRSVIANSQAAGRYGIHYRDETTGDPPLYSSYSSYVYGSNPGIPGVGSGASSFPANGGSSPPTYAKSHAVPLGYLPYLLTGRHSFREQVEFQAQVSYFGATYTSTFEGMRIALTSAGAFTTRGAGWAIRSMAAAVVCAPDSDSRAAQYKAHLAKTLGYYGANYTNKNNLGLVEAYSSYNSGVTTDLTNFMEDSLTMSVGWAYQVANEHLGSDRTRADAFAVWRMKHIVGRFGPQSGYCYRDAATYTCRYADSDLTSGSTTAFNAGLYADWATVYAKTIGANNCGASNALNGSSGGAPAELSTNPYSYWALAHTALAFAVDLGAPGATEGWQRLVSASNYAPGNFRNLPLWSVVPR
jgi:hypothetical protein